MHANGYKGRKFGRERDQRRALIKGLATSLIKHGRIETTLEKGKEVLPYVEKLVTKAKRGDLHSRRQIISSLNSKEVAHKLVDEVASKYTDRPSGHLSLKRTRLRRGDNAQLVSVGFIETTADAPAKETA